MQSKGYCIKIGLARYELWRPPVEAFATYRFNHKSLDIVFSGDRDVWPITALDIGMLRMAVSNARGRGWIVPNPYVRPHRETPGNDTICPGNKTAYADPPKFPVGNPYVWAMIVAACHEGTVPVPPKVAPEFFPALDIVSVCAFTKGYRIIDTAAEPYNFPAKHGGGFAMVDASGAVFCEPASAYSGGMNGSPDFVNRTAARIEPM
jgi:hypothetical protein